MQQQDMDKPGKSAGRNDVQNQAKPGNVDLAAPQSKVVNPGAGDPQANADGAPANGGVDMKRGF